MAGKNGKEIAPQTKVVLSKKHTGCNATKSKLASRIGCLEHHLTDGSLTVAMHKDGQLTVDRPGKAGTAQVAAKFFVPYGVPSPSSQVGT